MKCCITAWIALILLSGPIARSAGPDELPIAELPAVAAAGVNRETGHIVTGCTYRLYRQANSYRVVLLSDEHAGLEFSIEIPQDAVPLSEGQIFMADEMQVAYTGGMLTVRRKAESPGLAFGSNGLEMLRIEVTPDLLRPYRAEAKAWNTVFFVNTGRDLELRCGF